MMDITLDTITITAEDGADWIYCINGNNTARYLLGEHGKRPLICIGINTSTARPGKLDPTVRKVPIMAEKYGYDGWVMLNIYPKRATDPKNLPQGINKAQHAENLRHIAWAFTHYPEATVWAAWGNLIESRSFLLNCAKDILSLEGADKLKWVHKGQRTGAGHPRHPLYLAHDAPFYDFSVRDYLKDVLSPGHAGSAASR